LNQTNKLFHESDISLRSELMLTYCHWSLEIATKLLMCCCPPAFSQELKLKAADGN
jgi:hypothetical protein